MAWVQILSQKMANDIGCSKGKDLNWITKVKMNCSNSGHKCANCAAYVSSTDGTLGQGRSALSTADKMAARQEDHVDLRVHTDFTLSLFLQPSALLDQRLRRVQC